MIGEFTIKINHQTLIEAVQQYLRQHVGIDFYPKEKATVVVVTALSRNSSSYGSDSYEVSCEYKPFAEVYPIDAASMEAMKEFVVKNRDQVG